MVWYLKQHDSGYLRYLIMGKEIAPSTGTPHIQGFMWTTSPCTLQQVKKKFKGAWIACPGKDKGPDHWVEYCSKEDVDATILGVAPTQEEFLAQIPKGQGARTDLLDIKKKIDEGVPCESLMGHDTHFGAFASHRKYFHEYQSYKRRRIEFSKPSVHVIYGKSGSNKTRSVYDSETDLEELHVWEPHHNQWFDGYHGQDAVLFDEFRGQLPYGMLLCLLDGYPSRKVQTKGGMVHWSPKRIYLTSPFHPAEWYPNLAAADKIDQLLRRIDEIRAN